MEDGTLEQLVAEDRHLLHTVLRAFASSNSLRMTVSGFGQQWRADVVVYEDTVRGVRECVFALALSRDRKSWTRAQSELTEAMTQLLSHSSPHRAAMELLDAIDAYILEPSAALCSSGPHTLDTSHTGSASVSQGYVCSGHPQAMALLAKVLLDWTASIRSTYSRNVSVAIQNLEGLAGLFPTPDSSHGERDISHVPATKPYLTCADGITYVLILVYPIDLPEARSIIQNWRLSCYICTFYSRYILLPVPTEVDGEPPSLRIALLELKQAIERMAMKYDVFVLLRGISALRSFASPGSDTGIVPDCEYGHICELRLPSVIYVATLPPETAPCCPGALTCGCTALVPSADRWDWTSFAGTNQALRAFLREVETSDLYGFSEWTLRCALLQYAVSHQDEVSADIHRTAFNTKSGSLPFIPARDHTMPSKPCPSVANVSMQTVDGAVHFPPLQEQYDLIIQHYRNRTWDCIPALILPLTESLRGRDGREVLLHTLDSMSTNAMRVSANMSQAQKEALAGALGQYCDTTLTALARPGHDQGTDDADILSTVGVLLAEIGHDVGLVEKALVGYSYSLRPTPYREVEQHRAAWDDQRKELRSAVAMGNSRLHFLTTASQETVEVQNLRLSAWLAGISLEVILAPYQYSCDKSITFGRYLEENKHRIADDDVVVLMDAYDVLLLPAARSFAAALAASPTPIIFCSESGIHPDYSPVWFFPYGIQGSRFIDDLGQPRFLNGGCMFGRAGQVRELLFDVTEMARYSRDDQRLFTQLYLSRPHLVSLDFESKHLLTAYKFAITPGGMWLESNLTLMVKRPYLHQTVGLVHCNNRYSNIFYDRMVSWVRTLATYFETAPMDLAVIHSFWDVYLYD
eukprot:gene973-1099_t